MVTTAEIARTTATANWPPRYEWSGFCFYCGCTLTVTAPEASLSHEPFGQCPGCGASWCRVFGADGCPACQGEYWLHFYEALSVEPDACDPTCVAMAQGFAQCECGAPVLWRWEARDGRPVISMVAVDLYSNRQGWRFARESVSTDS